jgi:hypothetical protein
MADWGAYVDLYCERTAPGLLDEPANLFSNLAFFLATIVLLRRYAQAPQAAPPILRWLATLLFLIGVGSSAFHATATLWGEVADVLFIAVFIYVFVASFLRYAVGWPWGPALIGMPAYFGFERLVKWPFPSDAFNGSVDYFPAAAGLLLMTLYLAVRHSAAWRGFAWATATFVASLALRSVDRAWCARLPLGTHWAWHLLNAYVLYRATAALGDCAQARSAASAARTGSGAWAS